MPKRGSPNIKCSVINCICTWVTVSKNRHYFCSKHKIEADTLYKTYKLININALIDFDENKLSQVIQMREEYATKFLDYIDSGAHTIYINILKQLLLVEKTKRKLLYDNLMDSNAKVFGNKSINFRRN